MLLGVPQALLQAHGEVDAARGVADGEVLAQAADGHAAALLGARRQRQRAHEELGRVVGLRAAVAVPAPKHFGIYN